MNRHERRAYKAQSRSLTRITSVHESGHALARYLTADMMGLRPEESIFQIAFHSTPMPSVGGDGSVLAPQATTYGPAYSRPMIEFLASNQGAQDDPMGMDTRKAVARCKAAGIDVGTWATAKAIICMAGPAAEAIHTGRDINVVIRSHECRSDVEAAMRAHLLAGAPMEEMGNGVCAALETALKMLEAPKVWTAVLALADRLPSSGKFDGQRAAKIIGRVLGAAESDLVLSAAA